MAIDLWIATDPGHGHGHGGPVAHHNLRCPGPCQDIPGKNHWSEQYPVASVAQSFFLLGILMIWNDIDIPSYVSMWFYFSAQEW